MHKYLPSISSYTVNKSGYRGVWWDDAKEAFRARVTHNGVRTSLGSFITAEAAARAYDEALRDLAVPGAYFNFPKEGEKQATVSTHDRIVSGAADNNHCNHGHDLREHGYAYPNDNRGRKKLACKICNAEAAKRYKARKETKEACMSQRLFERSGGNGHQRCSYVVHCCRCGVTGSINVGTYGGSLAPEVTKRKLLQKGWNIGRTPTSDICPSCELKKHPARELLLKFPGSNRSMPIGIIEIPETTRKTSMLDKAIRAEPPKTMGRDERRLIFEKLNEVYLDEKRGYSDGWSDAKVADNMGVPRAWIAEVREPNFGPDRNEEQRKTILKDCEEAVRRCDASVVEIERIRAETQKVAAVLRERIQRFEGQ